MLTFISAALLVQSTKSISIEVDGIQRTGILVMPTKPGKSGSPLVFGFHGHGGGARQAHRSFGIEAEWPESVVVYLQGMPTPGQITDPDGLKNGWQKGIGEQGDRDQKFFDAALKWVKAEVPVNEKRIYSMGHSNGAAFTYQLWATHPGLFAAIGVSAGGFNFPRDMKPVPVIHIAGTADPLVKFRGQQFAIDRVRRINECESVGKAWGGVEGAERWDSRVGAPVVFVTHAGEHEYTKFSARAFVKFFKENEKG